MKKIFILLSIGILFGTIAGIKPSLDIIVNNRYLQHDMQMLAIATIKENINHKVILFVTLVLVVYIIWLLLTEKTQGKHKILKIGYIGVLIFLLETLKVYKLPVAQIVSFKKEGALVITVSFHYLFYLLREHSGLVLLLVASTAMALCALWLSSKLKWSKICIVIEPYIKTTATILIALLIVLNLGVFIYNKINTFGMPNVILISIDTLRADHLGCYAYFRKTSPTIDTLADEGVLFLNAFSQSPKTAPSHMSIMTSLYPDVHGIINLGVNDRPLVRLNDSIPTLAEVLKNSGYITVAFTGHGNVNAALGFDKGFDLYRHSHIGEAISWINNNYKKRFFLFFHTYAVHSPYVPPIPYNRKYDPDYKGNMIDVQDRLATDWENAERKIRYNCTAIFWSYVNIDDPRDLYFLKALYDGAINYMDEEMIKPLIENLKKLGLYKNTLIIFTADHGEAFKEHNNIDHQDLYKETLHVPLIMAWPENLPRSVRIKQLARSIDIMPTVIDILGIKTKIFMQGESLLDAIQGKDLHLYCYSTFNALNSFNFESIRNAEYTYIFNNLTQEDSYERLYDARADFEEQRNIINKRPQTAKNLRQILYQLHELCKKISCPGPAREITLDSETIQSLRTLGYLQ